MESQTVKVRVGYATSIELGLTIARQTIPPTVAHILYDPGCLGSCSFCPRGGGNKNSNRLSRVIWPEFPLSVIKEKLLSDPGSIRRICIQTAWNPKFQHVLKNIALEMLELKFPVSMTLHPSQTGFAAEMLSIGIDHIGFGLDAASETTYSRNKKRDWISDRQGVSDFIAAHPQKVEIHIIVGLGDSEMTLMKLIDEIYELGGAVALFALTPVTENQHSPSMTFYRKIQAFRALRERNLVKFDECLFKDGQIISFGKTNEELRNLLGDGKAFETSGCDGCNRPFYNESPRGPIYNYPRPLTQEEIRCALDELDVQSS